MGKMAPRVVLSFLVGPAIVRNPDFVDSNPFPGDLGRDFRHEAEAVFFN